MTATNEQKKKSPFRIGLTSVTFRKKSVEEIISIAKKADLDFIEWGGDVHIVPGDFAAAANAVALMRLNGLYCTAYGSYYRISERQSESAVREDFDLVCRTARALCAKTVRVWLGTKGSAETTAEERKKYLAEVALMAKTAEKYSLTVAFEFHGRTLNDNGTASASFLRDCKKANVKTYWQPLAFGDGRENLRAVCGHLAGVHVFHWDENNVRFPLSDGEKEWREYLSVLRESNVYPPLTMEFVRDDSEELFLSDALFLRSLTEEFSAEE